VKRTLIKGLKELETIVYKRINGLPTWDNDSFCYSGLITSVALVAWPESELIEQSIFLLGLVRTH